MRLLNKSSVAILFLVGVSLVTIYLFGINVAHAQMTMSMSTNSFANDPVIPTTMHHMPNFAVSPTIVSSQSGSWFSPSTWAQGRVPGADDVVRIASGHTVVYDGQSNSDIAAIGIEGVLSFATSKNTLIKAGTIFVYSNGKFHIGTEAAPISSNVKSEIIIANRPLATSGPDPVTGVYDPHQFGTGFIVLGELTMFGNKMNTTWSKLAQEPKAGQNTLVLEQTPTEWKAGDIIVLPDTRQTPLIHIYSANPNPPISLQLEELTIASVSGKTVTLTAPLKYDHLGGRDTAGNLFSLPHAGNLTRNIVMRSESATGVRGHTLFGDRARIDIRYSSFVDMGRTTAEALDNTEMSNGVVTKVGANQIGRYAVHFDHLMGPKNPANTGYQFALIGNSVVRSAKWAVTVHDSHFGLISNNVVYDAEGAGIATEAGNERENLFENNFVLKIGVPKQGPYEPTYGGVGGPGRPLGFGDFGWEGSGLWFNGNDNYVIGNVVADAAYAGVMYNARPAGFGFNIPLVPKFRGAQAMDSSEWKKYTYKEPAPKIRESRNNEVYASASGVWVSFSNEVGKLSDYLLWNIKQKGLYSLRNSSVSYDNFTIISDQNVSNANNLTTTNLGLDFGGATYQSGSISFTNSKVEGFNLGLKLPNFLSSGAIGAATPTPPVTVLDNVYFRNYVNIQEGSPRQAQKFTLLRDITLVQNSGPANKYLSMEPAGILTVLETNWHDRHVTIPSQTYVYNYNKQPGNNFEIFFKEQAPDYVMVLRDFPKGSGNPVQNANCPTPGLTNAQCWAQHQVAMLGNVATCSDDTTHPEINGFTCPISNSTTFQSVMAQLPATPAPSAPVTTKSDSTQSVQVPVSPVAEITPAPVAVVDRSTSANSTLGPAVVTLSDGNAEKPSGVILSDDVFTEPVPIVTHSSRSGGGGNSEDKSTETTLGTNPASGNPDIFTSSPTITPTNNTVVRNAFLRNMYTGIKGEDVKRLQVILNSDPATQIATHGDGSRGFETDFFGTLTAEAVGKFQIKHGLLSSRSEEGYGQVGPRTLAKINSLSGDTVASNATPLSNEGRAKIMQQIQELLATVQMLQQQLLNKKSGNTVGIGSQVSNSTYGYFVRNLAFGSEGEDVRQLQILLNSDPDTRITGLDDGAPGYETTFFGKKTEDAIKRFQRKHNIVNSGTPADTGYGAFGPTTRQFMSTR